MKQYFTAEEAADYAGVSDSLIRKQIGPHDKVIQLESGHTARVWSLTKVKAFKLARELAGKKPRKRVGKKIVEFSPEYRPRGKGNQYKFEVDEQGRKIPPRKTYRGRTCRGDGCRNPVPTGKIYCDECSHIFDAMRKNVSDHGDDSYQLHA